MELELELVRGVLALPPPQTKRACNDCYRTAWLRLRLTDIGRSATLGRLSVFGGCQLFSDGRCAPQSRLLMTP